MSCQSYSLHKGQQEADIEIPKVINVFTEEEGTFYLIYDDFIP
jgi:hypothetical protein